MNARGALLGVWSVALVASGAGRPEGPEAGLLVYEVDLEAVVAALPASRRALAGLEAKVREKERAVRAREEKLRAADLDPAAYQAAYERVEAFRKRVERELNAEQDRRLRPVIGRVRDAVRAAEADGLRVVFRNEEPFLTGTAQCDVTPLVTAALSEGQTLSLPRRADCRFRRFLYVDVDRVLASVPESKGEEVRLDALRSEEQAKLDALREAAKKAPPADRSAFDRRLADAFDESEARVRHAREDAEDRLYTLLLRRLEGLGARGTLFVEDRDGPRRLEPRCDATEWVVEHWRSSSLPDVPSACERPSP